MENTEVTTDTPELTSDAPAVVETTMAVVDEAPPAKQRRKETKPRVRLTEEQALEIIKLYAGGEGMSQKDLAKQFNVTQGAISHIVTGKRWARLKKVEPVTDLELVTADHTPEPTTSVEVDA